MDKLIRELLIDVKQKNAGRVSKVIEGLADNLENASAGTELLNDELNKIPRALLNIERAAAKANSTLNKMNTNKAFGGMSKTLQTIESHLESLVGLMAGFEETVVKGFNESQKAMKRMANETSRTFEVVGDQIVAVGVKGRKAGKGVDEFGNKVVKAGRAISSTSGAARGATRDFAAMAKIGGTLPVMYAAIASNVFVLQTALDALKTGDQLNRLMQFGTIVGQDSGVPVQNLARLLQEATGNAVSFEEAMRQASAAAAYGFSSKQIGEFALVARRAAAVLGVDMTDALNRVIKGVSKQEIELMDELGITIRLNEAFEKYVKTLNAANTGVTYNIQSLTSYQKQQAYANAVVEQSTKLFGNLDSVLRATPWEQFAANANSALRQVQMAAARYLAPVIEQVNALFYQSRMAQMGMDADAQAQTNAGIDPKNSRAMVNSYLESKKGLADMEKLSKNINVEMDNYEKRLEQVNKGIKTTTTLWDYSNKSGMGGMAAGIKPTEDQLKLLAERTQIEAKLSQLQKDKDNTLATRAKFQNNLEERTNALLKEQPELLKHVEQTGKTIVDPDKVNTLADALNSQYNIARNTASTLVQAMSDMTDKNNVGQVAATLNDVGKEAILIAKQTGKSVDEVIAGYGLGIKSQEELNKKMDAANKIKAIQDDLDKDALALEKKKYELQKSGVDSKKADVAIRNMEVAQLDKQIAAYQEILRVNGASAKVEDEIVKLQTKKYSVLNGTFKTEAKTAEIKDKIIGTDREIALLNDTTMNSQEFQIANLKLQLEIETERLAMQEKMAKREKETHDTRKKIAGLNREMREALYGQAAKDINAEAGRVDIVARQQGLGAIATLQAQVNAEQKRYNDLLIAAKQNGQVLDKQELQASRDKVSELQMQIDDMKKQQARAMRDSVNSSLGGVSNSTYGMDPEQTALTEAQNKMAFYDQSISKLSEINSAATGVAQSIGNTISTVMQFAEGSASKLSMIAAGAQTLASVFSYASQQRISGLDAEIAAEKNRDGQSEESKNKIKRLEAQKVAEQKKAAQQQIAIQTAVAVMMAAANPWPFPAIPMMAAAALAGAMSYAQAGSAAPPTGGEGDSAAKYLSIGERQKSIDTSISANAGELSYIQGARGIGSANSFTPRAEGGNMLPGVGYLLGEHGPELVTPSVPMQATSASDTAAGSGSGTTVIHQWNVQAMDAKSFRQYALENANIFEGAVESSLNDKGSTLRSNR
ncbi:putative tape measure protein [Serratia phage vB_SmaM-Kamaji]|nr:putative tape measure protein [Serratia phage vB_SmaM-Kamaji]